MYRFAVDVLRPYTLLVIVLAAVAAWLIARRRIEGRGRWLLASAVTLLWVVSMRATGQLALRTLESEPSPVETAIGPDDTLVVLSGGMRVYDEEHAELSPDTMLRCLHAAALYHRAGHCRVVVSGGKVNPQAIGPTLAAAMRQFLLQVGVRADDVVLEDRSQTTHENVVFSTELLRPLGVNRIVLVTDATHIGRAIRCFEHQGLEVVPAPCNYRVTLNGWSASDFLPGIDGLASVDTAFHEWLGLAWYRFRGRI